MLCQLVRLPACGRMSTNKPDPGWPVVNGFLACQFVV
jgi:hypothetical protein